MNPVFEEHRTLLAAGKYTDALRLSGEALAKAEEALAATREYPADDARKTEAARDFFDVAALHLNDTGMAQMERDEAVLSVSVPATVIIMRVNPETVANEYVFWLQMTAARLGEILGNLGEEALTEQYWRIVKLAAVTCDDFAARLGIDLSLTERNAMLRHAIEESHEGEILMNGQPIVPQSALDVLMDALAAMAALGWMKD
ncbi:MAG: hypothetical protein J6J93_07370 [Muribaculaceae bacterium]|nr:hypothetical protein [Muribaculaceae bacterium]